MSRNIKAFLVCGSLCFLWNGCSPKNDTGAANIPTAAGKKDLEKLSLQSLSGQDFVTFETDDTKERKRINDRTRALLQARDFEGLDALADKYRQTHECYARGDWKLVEVYVGLQPASTASDSEWESHIAIFNDWIKARPESITARCSLAEQFLNYAWKARGSGYANTVSDKGWQLLHDRLVRAVAVLRQAQGLKEHCPYWSSVMLRAAVGLETSKSEYDDLFKQGIQAYPDYVRYYGLRASYLLPRWNGKPGEWESDLSKSADQIGGDEGDMLYARTVWDMQQSRVFDNIFKESKLSWERIDKGFAVIKKRFPDSLAANLNTHFSPRLADRPKRQRNISTTFKARRTCPSGMIARSLRNSRVGPTDLRAHPSILPPVRFHQAAPA
jgi:hypothetical protein